MFLSTEQKATLKAYIESQPEMASQPRNSDGSFEIARLLNQTASPDFIVWKSVVGQDEIMQNGFDWVQVDNLSVGKARIWEWLFNNESRRLNPSKPNVRAGIDECWKGTAAMLAVRAAVYVHCKRKATVIEKLFATGTGTDAVPATMAIEGTIHYQEVDDIRNS